MNLDPFDYVEPCEPDCSPERHAYHQGQYAMAQRMTGEKVTRFEVIDHRHESMGTEKYGRAFVAHDVSIELSYQDEGRTLKVFLEDREEEPHGTA